MNRIYMKKIFLLSVLYCVSASVFAQLRMREVFAHLPDSVLPLMTKNNRLDCIDFIENNMEARVKNRFDDQVVLEVLTDDYLSIRVSEGSFIEMKLIPNANDTLIYVNRTYFGPAEDSEVKMYDISWNFIALVQRPDIEQFIKKTGDVKQSQIENSDTLRMIKSEAEILPLIKASLSSVPGKVEWMLQTAEFSREIKQVASKYLQPVICEL